MKSLRVFILGGASLLVLVLLIFFRSNLFHALLRGRILVNGLFDPSLSYVNFQEIRLENQSLKQELENIKSKLTERGKITANDLNYLEANVYSRYPFNDRQLLIIDRGSNDNLKVGMPVFAEKNILIGQISGVRGRQAEVQTIFDPAWRSSVAIGKSKIRALLKGGYYPKINLIPQDAILSAGDEIFNLSPDFPLKAFIGILKDVREDPGGVWQSANVSVDYKIENLDKVLVVTNFP